MQQSRRKFISNAGKATAAAGLTTFAASANNNMNTKNIFVHHVYFWLKNADNKDDLKKLIEGLTKLSKVKTIKTFHIGKPAGTSRNVIDASYSVSWLLFFDNKEDQDSYQTDPIHLKFVEECSPLWNKVIVYDSVDI